MPHRDRKIGWTLTGEKTFAKPRTTWRHSDHYLETRWLGRVTLGTALLGHVRCGAVYGDRGPDHPARGLLRVLQDGPRRVRVAGNTDGTRTPFTRSGVKSG